MKNITLNQWVSFSEFGCWYRVIEFEGKPALQASAMLDDGSRESDYCDVSDFYPQEVAQVNNYFGTEFKQNID